MDRNVFISGALLLFYCCRRSEGTVNVYFTPEKPAIGASAVVISCTRTNSPDNSDMTWTVDSSFFTSCSASTADFCLPNPSDYTVNTDSNEFNLTKALPDTSDCKTYGCNDPSESGSSELHMAYFNKDDVTPTEPGANKDGLVSVDTGCVLSATDLTITWTKFEIENGKETDYTSDRPSPVDSSARSTCSRTCHSEEDKTVTSGFTHTEYTESDFVEVQYKVTVSHSSYTDTFTWTSAKYKLKGRTTTSSTTTTTTTSISSTYSSVTNAPLVNTTAISTATNPPTTTPKPPCDRTCIIITVPVVVAVALTLSGSFFVCYLLKRRRNINKEKVTYSNQSYDKTSDTRGDRENDRL